MIDRHSSLALLVLIFLAATTFGQSPDISKRAKKEKGRGIRFHIDHEIKDVEGWKVHVDKSLLAGEHAKLGKIALRVLSNKLYRISLVMPEDKLKKLREVPIFLDREHKLRSMQYHPGAGWLRKNGYTTDMTKAVHIPRAAGLVRHERDQVQQWVVLHELAHAYHDRVLSFGNKEIRSAYFRVKSAKMYESVRHIRGHKTRHYALTNPMEFFAEMTEAYFGTNDFYPFVRGELKEADPKTYALLEKIWGKRR